MSWAASLLKILALRCEGASELASRELDEPLGIADRYALRGHLLVCRSCRRFRRQLRRLQEAGRVISTSAGTRRRLTTEARGRIVRAIREAIDPPEPPGPADRA